MTDFVNLLPEVNRTQQVVKANEEAPPHSQLSIWMSPCRHLTKNGTVPVAPAPPRPPLRAGQERGHRVPARAGWLLRYALGRGNRGDQMQETKMSWGLWSGFHPHHRVRLQQLFILLLPELPYTGVLLLAFEHLQAR